MEGKYCAIDNDDSSCHGYHIIKFYSSIYTLQADLSIDGQVISSSKMVCELNYFFTININSNCYSLQRTKYMDTIVSLMIIINGNINKLCYYSKDVLPMCLMYISHNDYNILSPLDITMKEHDNITDENIQIESIEFEILVLIVTKDTSYDYNDEFWDSI